MPAPYTGQCLCGGVSFVISSEPTTIMSCHCNHCQKGAGGVSQTIAKFSSADVKITAPDDIISQYTLTDTGSGNPKQKHFCRVCGCTLWTIPAAAEGTAYIIRTSLIDGGLNLVPNHEIYVKNRPKWMMPSDGVPQWEESRK
ncbi:Mss4-like protein [Stachybotrys elegans]|uniref:Mss4-like protein n=1 Tax=Stachybotrys elegans TaxID=80388 RepID=A0A8K0WTD9_9HYPO|nr:Mss4-like protein [Stachybotrys elegans]